METLEVTVKIKRVGDSQVVLPMYASSGAAGLDLAAHISAPVTIKAGERVRIPTGLAIQLPHNNLVALLFARSGLATRHGICLANGVGVIDADYTGEIICALHNTGNEPYIVNPGDRIAQIVFMPIAHARLQLVSELDETTRGAGGFGSTGR